MSFDLGIGAKMEIYSSIKNKIKSYKTDLQGEVSLTSNGKNITIKTEK